MDERVKMAAQHEISQPYHVVLVKLSGWRQEVQRRRCIWRRRGNMRDPSIAWVCNMLNVSRRKFIWDLYGELKRIWRIGIKN